MRAGTFRRHGALRGCGLTALATREPGKTDCRRRGGSGSASDCSGSSAARGGVECAHGRMGPLDARCRARPACSLGLGTAAAARCRAAVRNRLLASTRSRGSRIRGGSTPWAAADFVAGAGRLGATRASGRRVELGCKTARHDRRPVALRCGRPNLEPGVRGIGRLRQLCRRHFDNSVGN